MQGCKATGFATMSGVGIRRNKLHREGAILYQAVFDHRQAATLHTEINSANAEKEQNVKIGDLLFSHARNAQNSRHAKARIGGLVIAVSPFLHSNDTGTIEKEDRHVGIALTTFSHKVNRPEERLVVQCGGLATIDVEDDVCLGDMIVCNAPEVHETNKKKRGRASARRCAFKHTKSGKAHRPLLGRCLTNGRKGGSVDVILSANAPGLLWF